jgi:hypothetical protein
MRCLFRELPERAILEPSPEDATLVPELTIVSVSAAA